MAPTPESGPIERVSARALLVWGVALVAYVVAVFARTSLSATGVEAALRFHASSAVLSLFTVLQLAVYAAMQIPAGATVDRIGPRKAIAIGTALIGLGQLAIAFATGVPTAIGARVLVGSGDAFIFLSVVRLLPAWFPGRQVALVTQLTGMVGQLGQLLSLGPLVGVLSARGWESAYLLAGSMTLLVGALVMVAVRDGRPRQTRAVDVGTVVVATSAVAAPALADAALAAPALVDAALAGAETAAPTTIASARVRDDEGGALRRTWQNPGTRAGFWVHFTTPFSANAFVMLWGFAYMTKAEHVSEAVALAVLSAYVAGTLVFGPLLGVLTSRLPTHRSRLVVVIVVSQVAAWAVVLSWPGDAPPAALFVLAIALASGGPGSLIGFDFSRATNPLATLGLATGMVNAAGFISSLSAVLAVGIALDLLGQGSPALFTDRGFLVAWLVQVPIWILGLTMLRRSDRAFHAHLAAARP